MSVHVHGTIPNGVVYLAYRTTAPAASPDSQ
jgi:hypothetical protein